MILFLGLGGVSRLEEGVGWSATKNKQEKESERKKMRRARYKEIDCYPHQAGCGGRATPRRSFDVAPYKRVKKNK